MPTKRKNKKNLLAQIYGDSKFAGKHIIIIGGKIYATKTGQASSELLDKLLKQYPREIPTITYIPAEDSLILFL